MTHGHVAHHISRIELKQYTHIINKSMKAKIFSLMALVLCLVSCQTEPEGLDVIVGGEVDTVVTVTIPEAETRANSAEGAFVNVVESDDYTIRYIFAVYYGETCNRQVKYSDDTEVAFPVRLVPDRDYQFVVWADVVAQNGKVDGVYANEDGLHYDTSDLKNITLKNTWVAMDETRDAFTGTLLVEDFNGSQGITVNLTRPFAKLRVITTDMVALNNLGIMPTTATVDYKVQHYNAFNAFAGEAIGDSKNRNIKHENFDIKAYDDNVDNESMVLFTDYFFAKEGDVVKFEFNVYDQNNDLIKFNNFNTDIAVNRNYLTTIKGNVLTDGNNIKVEVEDGGKFDGEENWPDENAEQLAYVAMFGGEVTLTEDITLTQPLEIAEGANVVINLGDKTITGALAKDSGAIIENNGILTIVGGTLENTAENGDAVINNTGELVLESVKIKGAPLADGGYSAYAVISSGKMTINDGTEVSADRGCLKASGNGETTINGGTFVNNDIGARNLTSHVVDVENGGNNTLTINGGTFKHLHTATSGGVVICNRTRGTVYVNGGNFSGGNYYGNDNLSDYGYGGTFSVTGGIYSAKPATKYIATGYKAIAADGIYYVLPETIANAAEAENVTTVTESTADVATALATNNGEATLFMWNDVAYIAKYGEVVITSAADEATTVRGVVENSTGLTSATVADGIEVVGNRTFRKCTNLETVALPNTLTEIGPAVFQSCSKLANITIPESVTTIGEGAFAECTSLTSINIPAGITRLEKDVLRNTGLVSIEIPASVNYIGTWAFRDCESLTEIKILSPEFTIENNSFTNMAAPVPTMTIHVVNNEMKAYLESTLTAYDKTYITVVGPKSVSNAEGLNTAVTDEYAFVNVAAGNYTFPSNVAEGVTINCAEGTVFTGTSGLNINGATVIGAEFKNESGVAVSGTINGTFKNCTFTGSNALRSCYVGETCVFENCDFSGNVYGVHFDGGSYPVTFRECTFSGFNAFAAKIPMATFEECTFVGNGKSGYNGANLWGSAVLDDCEFTFNGTTSNEWIDCIGTDKTYEITNCTINGVPYTVDNHDIYPQIFSRNNATVKINGVDCAL